MGRKELRYLALLFMCEFRKSPVGYSKPPQDLPQDHHRHILLVIAGCETFSPLGIFLFYGAYGIPYLTLAGLIRLDRTRRTEQVSSQQKMQPIH